eukprot:3405600-Pyramimonas_sp.AAC.1
MAIPATATIARVDGLDTQSSGSEKIAPQPLSGRGKWLLLEYSCGPQSRIGDPKNFVDNSCK